MAYAVGSTCENRVEKDCELSTLFLFVRHSIADVHLPYLWAPDPMFASATGKDSCMATRYQRSCPLLCLCMVLLTLAASLPPAAPALAAPAPSDDYDHRYVVFLNGIRTSSREDRPLDGAFDAIEHGLRELGVSHFVYFSYSAARYPAECLGWAVGLECLSQVTDPTAMRPVYEEADTKLPVDQQAEVLDWLLNRIVAFDGEARIDLVGYSLGGIVASYWGATTGGASPIRDHVRSLTLIDSPVGGIPMGYIVEEDCGFLLLNPACNVWQDIMEDMFGKPVLRQLQLPGDAEGSIIDTLPQAARNFPLTSIQSTADYLVNDVGLPLCTSGCMFTSVDDRAPVGSGTQYWINAPHVLHFEDELGGDGLARAGLGYLTAVARLNKNHGTPRSHPKTVAWVREAVATLPAIARPGADTTLVQAITTPSIPARPDIVLLADTTGSMGGAIANVQLKAREVIQQVKAVQPDAHFGAAQYKDFFCDPAPYTLDQPMTADAEAVQGAITSSWMATGGCDTPEAQLYALYQLATRAEEVGWRPGSTRIVAWFGDAPGHDPSSGVTLAMAIAALEAARIRVIAVDVSALDGCGGSCGQASAITEATNGRLLALNGAATGLGAPARTGGDGQGGQTTAAALSEIDDVAGAILAGLQSLPVTVTPSVSGCGAHIDVTVEPASATVPSGTTVTFTTTVTVKGEGAPPEAGSCSVDYLLDGRPVADEPGLTTPIAVPSAWAAVAPLVTATAVPAPGANGWSAGPVTVSLKAVDRSGGAGILSLNYRTDGAQSIPDTRVFSDSETIVITETGRTTLTFYAVDDVGNVAQREVLVIQRLHQVWLPLSVR